MAGLRPDLARWEARPFHPESLRGPRAGDRVARFEREVGREPPGPPVAGGPHRRVAEAIFAYRIFAPARTAGVLRRVPVEIGDTVGMCYRLAPGVRVFFAARVFERFDEEQSSEARWRTGFTYRTLAGHPEVGEETFAVTKDLATGAVRAGLSSWSRHGTWLAKMGGPLVRRLQTGASEDALDVLARAAQEPGA